MGKQRKKRSAKEKKRAKKQQQLMQQKQKQQEQLRDIDLGDLGELAAGAPNSKSRLIDDAKSALAQLNAEGKCRLSGTESDMYIGPGDVLSNSAAGWDPSYRLPHPLQGGVGPMIGFEDELHGLDGKTVARFRRDGHLKRKKKVKKRLRNKSLTDDFVQSALVGRLDRVLHFRCQVPIDSVNRKWGMTALMAAAGNGHLPCVRYLVTCRASVDVKGRRGWTALMLAARTSRYDVVEFLVRSGADAECRTKHNQSVYNFGEKGRVEAAVQRGQKHLAADMERKKVANGAHKKPVVEWTQADVGEWLSEAGFGDLAQDFKINMIDGDALIDIEERDLLELEIGTKESRAKLAAQIEMLRIGPD